MRILYDGYIYSIQKAGGINRYFANLISGLPKSYEPTLTIGEERTINFPTCAGLEIIHTNRHQKIPLRPRRFFERFDSHYHRYHLDKVSALKFDLAHPTYYELLTQRGIGSYKCPVVLTVYDMLHEKFMSHMDKASQNHIPEMKREAVRAATAILCISESTKRDLMEICGVPEEKITVTYLASDFSAGLAFGEEVIPKSPYFLFVGSRASYKNFDLTLSAFQHVAGKRADIQLCVAGAPLTTAETTQIAALGLTGRIVSYDHPTDTHLAKLYRNSLALVYPSLYEGFGIPPLEAMICGTVVVASNTSSLPEVIGDAGLLFDPEEEHALEDRLIAVAQHAIDRNALVAAGRERASLFSWKKTVEQTISVYQSIV